MIKRIYRYILAPYRKWREYRDRKFVERIDKLYFHHDGHGNRFFKGCLYAVCDDVTDAPGVLSSSPVHTLSDIRQEVSGIRSRYEREIIPYYRKHKQQGLEEGKNTPPYYRERR